MVLFNILLSSKNSAIKYMLLPLKTADKIILHADNPSMLKAYPHKNHMRADLSLLINRRNDVFHPYSYFVG